eukprot:716213_1
MKRRPWDARGPRKRREICISIDFSKHLAWYLHSLEKDTSSLNIRADVKDDWLGFVWLILIGCMALRVHWVIWFVIGYTGLPVATMVCVLRSVKRMRSCNCGKQKLLTDYVDDEEEEDMCSCVCNFFKKPIMFTTDRLALADTWFFIYIHFAVPLTVVPMELIYYQNYIYANIFSKGGLFKPVYSNELSEISKCIDEMNDFGYDQCKLIIFICGSLTFLCIM